MPFLIVSLVFLFDQLSKLVANHHLRLEQSFPVIRGVFHLTLVYNRGAAFGIFRNQTVLFIATSLFALVLVYFKLKAAKQQRYSVYTVALSLIAAGALGNLVDRLFFGYVIDFLDLRIWPVFNVADSAITIGAILLGYVVLIKGDK